MLFIVFWVFFQINYTGDDQRAKSLSKALALLRQVPIEMLRF